MSVAFRSYAKSSYTVRTNTTLSKPAGAVDDDILIACLGFESTDVTVTPPAGWTEYTGPFPWTGTGAVPMYNHYYWKRASSEGASWTWSHANVGSFGTVFAYSGCETTGDPNDATPTQNSGTGNKLCVGLSITTANTQSMAIMFWTIYSDTGGQTSPSGYTQRGNPNDTFAGEEKMISPAGVTGNQTVTFVNNDEWVSFFIALKSEASSSSSSSRSSSSSSSSCRSSSSSSSSSSCRSSSSSSSSRSSSSSSSSRSSSSSSSSSSRSSSSSSCSSSSRSSSSCSSSSSSSESSSISSSSCSSSSSFSYGLSETFILEKNKKKNAPINLYTLYDYDGAGGNLYFAEYKDDVLFDGITYPRFPMSIEPVGQSATGEIDVLKLRISNVNRLLQFYLENYDLRGKKIGIKMVWANLLDDPANVMEYFFYIDSWVTTDKVIEFSCTTKYDVLDVELPFGRYMRGTCRWEFKSAQCGYTGSLNTCDKTMANCRERNNILRYGGTPSVPMNRTFLG